RGDGGTWHVLGCSGQVEIVGTGGVTHAGHAVARDVGLGLVEAYLSRLLDALHAGQTGGLRCVAMPAMRNRRKVGAPLFVIVLLSILTALLLLLFTAANPGGTLTALVLSSLSMLVVLFCYRWLDRWEPEPRRLLQLAFLWGASVAVLLAVGLETFGSSVATARPLV